MTRVGPVPVELASRLETDASLRPTVLFTLPVNTYDVEFESLDFVKEERLLPADRAILALAQAMGRASADDVRSYLGLGWELSPALVASLVSKELVRSAGEDGANISHLNGLLPLWPSAPAFRYLNAQLGWAGSQTMSERTLARRLCPPDEARHPLYELTQAGTEALASGVRRYLTQRSARLWWIAHPLCFLGAPPESAGYAAAKRGKPLLASDVPAALRTLDEELARPSDERGARTGLSEQAPSAEGLQGLVRTTPGSSFQVFDAPEMRSVCLVLAGAPEAVDRIGGPWQVFVWLRRARRDPFTLRRMPHLDEELSNDQREWLGCPASELARRAGLTPAEMPATFEAIPVFAESPDLVRLLGAADTPTTSWVSVPRVDHDPWQRFLRVRALPASRAAAVDALLALLSRRQAALRSSFRHAIDQVWGELTTFWGMPHLRPPEENWVRHRLWERHELRGLLCAERLERDLVAPYALSTGGAP